MAWRPKRARPRAPAPQAGRRPVLAPALAIGGIVSGQGGSALVVRLLDHASAGGIACARFLLAGLVLLALTRPRVRRFGRDQRRSIAALALAMAVLGESSTLSLRYLPLGASATYMFVGPLGVALATSRRSLDIAWVVLAATGIVLLSGGRIEAEALGIAVALLAGLAWAAYILSTSALGARFAEGDGQAVAIAIAAVLTVPGAIVGGRLGSFADPQAWPLLVAAGALALPLAARLELAALRRTSARLFGVLMSLEPAIAAVMGLVALRQGLCVGDALGIGCVVVASAAASLQEPRPHAAVGA